MLTDTTGADATTALRRNAIHKLEQAAADAVAAGLSWREAKEILAAGYGYPPIRSYEAAGDIADAVRLLASGLFDDLEPDGRGYLSWDLPYCERPRWHPKRPALSHTAIGVPVPGPDELAAIKSGGSDDGYLAQERAWLDEAIAYRTGERPIPHGIDASAPAPRDGIPLDELRAMCELRDREHWRAERAAQPGLVEVTQRADGTGATTVLLDGLRDVHDDAQGRLVGRTTLDEIPLCDWLSDYSGRRRGFVRVFIDRASYAAARRDQA